MPALGRTNALDDAVGFEGRQMLFYSFGRNAGSSRKSHGTQRIVLFKQGENFLSTFSPEVTRIRLSLLKNFFSK